MAIVENLTIVLIDAAPSADNDRPVLVMHGVAFDDGPALHGVEFRGAEVRGDGALLVTLICHPERVTWNRVTDEVTIADRHVYTDGHPQTRVTGLLPPDLMPVSTTVTVLAGTIITRGLVNGDPPRARCQDWRARRARR